MQCGLSNSRVDFPRGLPRFEISLPPLPPPLLLLPLCSPAADQTQSLSCIRRAVFFFSEEGSLRNGGAETGQGKSWLVCVASSLFLTGSQVIIRELASTGPASHLSHDHLDSLPDTPMSERDRRHEAHSAY